MLKRFLIMFYTILLSFIVQLYAQTDKTISLKEVLSIGGPDEETIYQWAGVCTDDSGYIYITDMMDYSIKKFDVNGKLIKRTGCKGHGPGEFIQPVNIYNYQNRLYILDIYNAGISVFDKKLNFIRFIRLKYPINDLEVINNNKIIFNNSVVKTGLTIIDSMGTKINEINFNYSQKDDGGLINFSSSDFEVDDKGDIYLAFLWQDKILKCNAKGDKIWERKYFGGKKSKKKKIRNFMVPTETYYKSIALDSKNNVFVLGGDISKNKSKDVYVFSSSGNMLTTLTLDYPTHIIYIDKDNFLYTRAYQSTCLKKYKIVYMDVY